MSDRLTAPPKVHGQGADHSENIPLGATALLGEITLAVGLSAIVKFIVPDVSFLFIMFCRYLFCLPLLLTVGAYKRGAKLYQVANHRTVLARTCAGLCGLSTWFLAVTYIDIGLATVLGQTAALFITLLGPLFGETRVGWRRLLALAAGFFGVVVVIWRPEQVQFEDGFMIGVTLGLISPIFVALMFLLLRRLGKTEAVISTALWYNSTGMLVFGAAFWQFPAPIPERFEIWLLLIAIGALASVQQYLMGLSHKLASATSLAPFHYFAVPIGVAIGLVIFDEQLTWNFTLGTLMIISSTFYIMRRSAARKK